MSSLSGVEHGSNTPDDFETRPSTSGQTSSEDRSSSREDSATQPGIEVESIASDSLSKSEESEQPIVEAPSPSIECGSENLPPATPSNQDETESRLEQPKISPPPYSIEIETIDPSPEALPKPDETESTSEELDSGEQPRRRAPPSSIELDPDDPRSEGPPKRDEPEARPKQLEQERRAPPCSIELDPNATPLVTPPTDPGSSPAQMPRTLYEKFRIQIPVWKDYFEVFEKPLWISMVIFGVACVLFLFGYIPEPYMKEIFMSLSTATCIFGFWYFWTRTEPAPEFFCNKQGKPVTPEHRKATTDEPAPQGCRKYINCYCEKCYCC